MTKRFEVGILSGQPSILRIELDRAQQTGDRLGKLATKSKDNCSHVVGVIVKRFVVDDLSNVPEGLGVFAGIEGERCGVKLFLNATWRGFWLRPALPIANVEIELNPFVQLLLIGVVREHRAEEISRLSKLVSL
jgi:hypothetical protein